MRKRALLCYMVLLWIITGCGNKPYEPSSLFQECTGLEYPDNANIIQWNSEYSLFQGDGRTYIIFDTNISILEKWIESKPPWRASNWKNGPVPYRIASNCFFSDTDTHIITAEIDGDLHIFNSVHLKTFLHSKTIRYVAKRRGPPDMPWHNGYLLVLDLSKGRVWLNSWDY